MKNALIGRAVTVIDTGDMLEHTRPGIEVGKITRIDRRHVCVCWPTAPATIWHHVHDLRLRDGSFVEDCM